MDPASAIGLGLGAASLAIQLFDGAIKGFKIFEEAVHADRDCQTFRLMLLFEHNRLWEWANISGLLHHKSALTYEKQMKHNSALVLATLSELHLSLKSLRRTELRYETRETSDQYIRAKTSVTSQAVLSGSIVAQDLSDTGTRSHVASLYASDEHILSQSEVQTYLKAIGATTTEVEVPKHRHGLNHILAGMTGLAKISASPKRVLWAVRDKEKFRERLSRVKQLVDFLQDSLRGDQIDMLVDSMKSFRLLQLQVAESVEELKTLLQAQQTALPLSTSSVSAPTLSGTTAVNSRGSTSTSDQSNTEASEARFLEFWTNATQFSIEMNTQRQDAIVYQDRAELDVTSMSYDINADPHSITLASIGDNKPVWIEWKSYTPQITTNEHGHGVYGVPEEMKQRIARLLNLLQAKNKPVEFCVPECLGYFEDRLHPKERRFGFVYQAPTRDTSRWPPRTLLSYYQRDGISLSTRISLAQWISRWLLHFHAVNWLHKGLRSASILFFEEQKSVKPGQPYISGFEFSRTASGATTSTGPPDDMTWALYTHPSYLGPQRQYGFRKTYDIYSLGIILIEIAYWKPIDEILGFANDAMALTTTSLAPRAAHGPSGSSERAPPVERQAISQPEISEIIRVREQLLVDDSKVLQHIREVMGDRYHDATRACIEGMSGFGLDDNQDQYHPSIGALLQRAFIEIVVDPLKSISL